MWARVARKLRIVLIATGCLAVASDSFAQDEVTARMQAWSTALGVECTHCHVAEQWSDPSKPTFDFARRMHAMVQGLNAGPMRELREITCVTCHRGQPIPARLQRATWEKILAEHQAEFEGQKNRALAMSVYAASLGVDCSHCHEADRSADTKPAKAIVAKMLPIFEEIPKYFDDSRRPVRQCFMCHQGRNKPEK